MSRLALRPLLLAGLLAALGSCASDSVRSPKELGLLQGSSRTPRPTTRPTVLPRPIYFLSDAGGRRQVWRLELDGETGRPVTTAGSGVVCFDLSPQGRLAYATEDGALYACYPGRSRPQRILDLGTRSGRTECVSVSWSPDGQQIAYALYTPPESIPEGAYADEVWAHDGLWLHRVAGGADTQLLDNIPFGRITGRHRTARGAEWSPRGDALLVRLEGRDVAYYGIVELSAPYTLSVVDPQPEHTPLYGQVAWMPDGGMLLRGGAISGALCSLTLVERASSRVLLLLDGQAAAICAAFPYAFADGRIAFLMSAGAGTPFRLHLGRLQRGRLEYAPVGDEGFAGVAGAVWEPAGKGVALLVGGSGEGDAQALVYAPLDGGPSRPIAPGHPHLQHPIWQP